MSEFTEDEIKDMCNIICENVLNDVSNGNKKLLIPFEQDDNFLGGTRMKTDITVVLDRSGSMSDCVSDTVGGFNTFLAKQKETGNCFLTLIQFDHEYLVEYNGVPIENVKPLVANVNYTPRGSTALYDAIGRAIHEAQERIGRHTGCRCCDSEVPKVIFVIQTDGHENASREYTDTAIKELIQHNRTKHDWQFVFMGADVDTMDASRIGIHRAHAMRYGKGASAAAFDSMSVGVNKYKASRGRGMSATNDFFETDTTTSDKVEIKEDEK
jgi:hypothetical protein